MFCSDGVPAYHTNFSFVLHNHCMREHLQGQGQFGLSTEEVGPHMTVDEFLYQYSDKYGQSILLARLQNSAENISGPDPYWKSVFRIFRVTSC